MSSKTTVSRAAAIAIPPFSVHEVGSDDGTRILYDYYPAADERNVVLVVPGFWRNRDYPSMRQLAAYLHRDGHTAAIVDPRGHGDSGGTYGFNTEEHHDVAAVARDLVARHGAERILLLGFSAGAAIAISAAARYGELPWSALLLISAVADIRQVVPRINPLRLHRHIAFSQALKKPRFSWTFRSRKPLAAIDDIGTIHLPIVLIHVKNDWLVDHKHSLRLYEKANEPKELHIIDIEGNYHADRIFNVAADEIYPIIDRFLDKVCGGGGRGSGG